MGAVSKGRNCGPMTRPPAPAVSQPRNCGRMTRNAPENVSYGRNCAEMTVAQGRSTRVTRARRDTRRSVASTAGPSTTSAIEFVIARPVSQPAVEVSSV